jgi:aspartate/methionine/tyrosine aminotransferase
MKNEIERMQVVQSPIIPVVGELIRSSPGTISLGQGVVYYGPPPEAAQQISLFLAEPQNHKYQAVEGITPLLEAISTKLSAENQIPIDQSNWVYECDFSNC